MVTKTLSSTCISGLAVLLLFLVTGHEVLNSGQYPVVVSTWPFLEAVRAAWRAVDNGGSLQLMQLLRAVRLVRNSDVMLQVNASIFDSVKLRNMLLDFRSSLV
ncbi:hypothetical protein M0R45_037789 [Rubus argutus]|uniref:Uncharacterized protein n=1 Tax=Rubus argutus TaxID=59490 RepID=A0AAW1W5F9_RUBAR